MSPTATIRERKAQTGGGGRGPVDRRDYGGGSGGGRGDDHPNYGERLRRCRLGIAVALVAIVSVFVAFTTAFLLRQSVGVWDPALGTYVRDWRPVPLPISLLVCNSILLAFSSVTVELARRVAAEEAVLAPLRSIPGIVTSSKYSVPWLGISVATGFAFLAGQAVAWRLLIARGLDISSGASTAFFYILTGTHAVHLIGGLLALLYAAATTSLLSKPPEVHRIVVDVAAWYWHVMTVLWLYIFALLALAQ